MNYTRSIVLTICACLLAASGQAQINLVLNPSFELYSHCPDLYDEAKYCTHWMSLDSMWSPPDWVNDPPGVPDFIHTCGTDVTVRAPYAGPLYPHSGNGMMQIQIFYDQLDTGIWTRDYLQGHLAHALDSGKVYFVSFYAANQSFGPYSIRNIGAYLDNGSIDTTRFPGKPQTHCVPQITDTSVQFDTTLTWRKISGKFTATGLEKLITIGNFSDGAHTLCTVLRDTTGSAAYGGYMTPYLFDDISVIDCDNIPFAGHDTVIHPGDSAFLGTREGLLPYTWYKLGDTTPITTVIGTSGIMVRPTVTTSYVLKQELCKVVRWDTIKVWVWPDTPSHVGVEQLALTAIHIYPNPAIEEIIVEGAKGYTVGVFDMLGRCVVPLVAATDKEVLPTHQLAIGVYFVRIIDEVTGEVVVRRVVKE